MSQSTASADFFARSDVQEKQWDETPQLQLRRPPTIWSAERFGQDQLQGLVRQLFVSANGKSVRHVLFSAMDAETDTGLLTQSVAEALAIERIGNVAVMARHPQLSRELSLPGEVRREDRRSQTTPLRQSSFRLKENLWLVPNTVEDRPSSAPKLHASLCGLRREFDYSIVEGPVADSHEALALAQLVDGVVLVLSARYTRRASARNVKRSVESANARILGTVLVDRVFPIPENIYRRL